MTIADRLRQEGEQRGEQRGIQIGEQRGIQIGEQRGEQRVQSSLVSAIRFAEDFLGLTPTPDKSLFSKTLDELQAFLGSLRSQHLAR